MPTTATITELRHVDPALIAAWAAEQHPHWCPTLTPGCGIHAAIPAELVGDPADPGVLVGALMDDATRDVRVEVVVGGRGYKLTPALARKVAVALNHFADLGEEPGECRQFAPDQIVAQLAAAAEGHDAFVAVARANAAGAA